MKSKISKTKPPLIILILCTLIALSYLPSQSQQISTVAEIYNYDVGDIFHIREFGAGSWIGFEEQFSYEITGKSYSSSNDTLFYTRYVKTALSTSEEPEWVFDEYLDTVIYTNLNALIYDGNIDSVFSNSELYNGRIINDNSYVGSYYYGTDRFIVGCGGPYIWYYDWEQNITHDLELKYFKKGDEEWGDQLMVSIKPMPLQNQSLRVYPNPCHSNIKLDLSGQEFDDAEGMIYSMSGELVLCIPLIANQVNCIKISELSNGSYILKINGLSDINQLILKY